MAAKPKTVSTYIAALPRDQQPIARELRKIVTQAAPKAEEAIKWGVPVYSHNGLLCSIMPFKAHINLLFYKGTSLSDPNRLLEGTGKGCRHVKIRSHDDIRATQFKKWVKEAVALNAQ